MAIRAIINVNSGSADRLWQEVYDFCRSAKVETACCDTKEQFLQAVRDALSSDCERIIVAGGDGTVSSAIATTWQQSAEPAELAIIPLGTGNDLARSLGIFNADILQACETALEGPSCPIDLICITEDTETIFVNAATGGFGGEVTSNVTTDDKRRWGGFAYWLSALSRLAELQEYHISLELDGHIHEQDIYGLAVGNGRFVGGGFQIAPDALLDDGLMDIVVIPALPKVELLSAGINFFLGREDPDGVQVLRASQLHLRSKPEMLFSVDGEPLQSIEADFQVIPKALKIACANTAEAIAMRK